MSAGANSSLVPTGTLDSGAAASDGRIIAATGWDELAPDQPALATKKGNIKKGLKQSIIY